jgi:prevent-host-death family protein
MIVKSTEIKNNFGKYLKLLDQEDIVVVRNGTPVARITSLSGWEKSGRVCEMAENYSYGGIRMSYEKFMEMYENTDDRYEYIDGEAYLLTSPRITHQSVLGNLYAIFRQWFKGKPCMPYLSPFDVKLAKDENNKNVVQPDLLVICDPENKDAKDKYTGTPTLTLEILSESTKRLDLIKKLDLYMQTGVGEYWIVNYMNREVTVYEFKGHEIANMKTYTRDDTVKSFLFEGLTADMREIFE